MEELEKLLQSMKGSNITLSNQSMTVRKQMALILPKLVFIQNQDILEKEALMNLSADLLTHAWSLLQLIVILIHESEQGE